MLVQQAVDEFLLSLTAEGRSAQTVGWYASLLGSWVEVHGRRQMDRISARDMRQYLADLRSRPPKRGSRNRTISLTTLYAHHRALSTLWTWAESEWRLKSPMANIKRPRRPPAVPRAATQSDLVRMWDAATETRDRVMLAILVDTGCRVGDLCGLKWSDLDLEQGRAVVVGKGGKPRVLFMSSFTCDLLRHWWATRPRQTEHVLYGRLEDTISRYGVARALRRLAQRADVQGRYNAHSIRHAFARAYLLGGGDAGNLSRILGHASVAFTLEVYGLFDVAGVQAQHAQYSPIDAITQNDGSDT